MKTTMERKLSRLEQNRKAISASALLADLRISASCACLYALDDLEVTTEQIKEARKILKSKTGIFSNFRGHTETPVSCMLAGRANAAEFMDNCLKAYDCLRKKFNLAEYLPIAAVIIADSVSEERYEEIAERTYQIFKLIQKDHPLITGREDELMCVLLALRDAPVEKQAAGCEFCYQKLKGNFGMLASNDGVQSLSQVITAAGGNLEETCQRAIDLYQYFKEKGSAFSNGYTLGALGALAILPVPVELLGEQVLEISEELSHQSGYGLLGIGRETRMIHAGLLAASDYVNDGSGVIAAIQGTISAIIAEEIMIISMVSAQTAVSSGNKG